MKNHRILYLGVLAIAIMLTACGNSGKSDTNGKKFNPTERQSSLTESERAEALAAKRAELEGINLEQQLYSHGVRFTIVRPHVKGDITEDIAERISMKMLQIASQNGISCIGTNPGFVLGTEIVQTGRTATGTAPQKMTTNYELTFKVMNTASGDVYASAVQEVMGVGNSFEEASQNAVKEIKNSDQMQQMLQTASERIVKWYDENVQVLKNQVAKAEGDGNFALAMAILSAVPEQAKTAFEWASTKQPETLKAMLHKQAADMLGEMEALIASQGDEFNPAVGAYFKLIPTDAPEHAKAQQAFAEYEKKCQARRNALEAKAERDEQAARELEKLKMLYDHESDLANIEADKIKTKYQCQASAREAEAQAKASSRSGGLFSSLGDVISGVSDRVFKVADVTGSLLSDKLGLEDYME